MAVHLNDLAVSFWGVVVNVIAVAVVVLFFLKLPLRHILSCLCVLDEYLRSVKLLLHIIFLPFCSYSELTKDHERKYIARDEYLSGNVREKQYRAEYFNTESGDDRFSVNIEELKKVIPKDLSPAEISAPLGATWIPTEYINRFIRETFDVPFYYGESIKASYSEYGAEWSVSGKRRISNFKTETVYGTRAKNGFELLEDCLNLRHTKVFDPYIDDEGKTRYKINETETELARDKQEEIKQAFED